MFLTQKTQYAVQALIELAKVSNNSPLKTAKIADSQKIPLKFLEVIMNHLKRSGIVESKRGYKGGYIFKKSPEKISVGDILRIIQNEPYNEKCVTCKAKKSCPFQGECILSPLREEVRISVFEIYDNTTIKDLILKDTKKKRTKK